jgi:hypothetical protein
MDETEKISSAAESPFALILVHQRLHQISTSIHTIRLLVILGTNKQPPTVSVFKLNF